jgi:hypothetical protein
MKCGSRKLISKNASGYSGGINNSFQTLAGAGIKGGIGLGETDPIGFYPTTPPVHIRDFQATVLHLLGLDHKTLQYAFQGLDQRLTGVNPARVVNEILS